MDNKIDNLIDKIDSLNLLNENNDDSEENIVKNLNSLVKEIKSKLSESEQLLDHINKMLTSNFIQNVVYSYLQVSVFKKLKEHLSIDDEDLNSGLENSNWNEKSVNILKLTIELLAIVCERTPSNIEKLDHLIDRIELILEVLKDSELSNQFYNSVFEIKIGYLERQRQTCENNKKKVYSEPLEDFRGISIIPSIDEITSSNGLFLRPNLKFGSFDNAEHYLDVHFRLLREDYVGSLREGVMEYLAINNIESCKVKKTKQSAANIMNIRIYKNVEILEYLTDEIGIYHIIKFEMINRFKRIRWETSKRLIQGSLVCLTNDNFKTVYFATIYDRDVKMLNEGKILLKFEDWISVNNKFFCGYSNQSSNFIMVETLAYFESYRYNLESLKMFDEKSLPFAKHIVYSQNSEIDMPKYLRNRKTGLCYDFEPIVKELVHQRNYLNVDILQLNKWPNSSILGLNESQYKAVQLALTKELVVIQGPPGTGN